MSSQATTVHNQEIVAIIFLVVITPLLFLLVRWLFRYAMGCFREIRDLVRIARRGVLTPEEVREEFIATTGREPTVAEVHDLYDMIKSEHRQALLSLGAIIGTFWVFNRGTQGKVLL